MILGIEGAVDSDAAAEGTASRIEDAAVALMRRRRFAVDGMTCTGCKKHVERALMGIPGVLSADVDLVAATVDLSYDVTLVTTDALRESVGFAGYGLREMSAPESLDLEKRALVPRFGLPWWPIGAGLLAMILLSALYLAIIGLIQGLDHAIELLGGDWYLAIPIVVGFGVQVGLFVHVRMSMRLRCRTGSVKALTGAGTGTSTVSMVACCAHHLTDVLPIIGLSGAALFLNEYRAPLMGLGIITNAVGIVLMARLIRRSGRTAVLNGSLHSGSTIGPSDPPGGDAGQTEDGGRGRPLPASDSVSQRKAT